MLCAPSLQLQQQSGHATQQQSCLGADQLVSWAQQPTSRLLLLLLLSLSSGEAKEYIYPNQRPATGWYHDHALHITLDNAYHGLSGFLLMTDKLKDGGCGAPFNLEVGPQQPPDQKLFRGSALYLSST